LPHDSLKVLREALRTDVASLTDRPPRFFRAPGRVNLIGEHVDYSGGLVLPLAIDRETIVAAAPRDDRRIRIHSRECGELAAFDLDEPSPRPARSWGDYVRGMTLALRRRVPLVGADLAVGTTLPLGGGLSSSAAFEIAVGMALLALAGVSLTPHELARAAQEAENGFVGVRSGLMDPLACALGMRDHALLIDCRSGAVSPIRLPDGIAIAIVDSNVRRALASSAYNRRRAETEEAARRLGVPLLRDVTPEQFARGESGLPEPVRRRARHVVGEIARVTAAAGALRCGDVAAVGRFMNASHASLRDDYEVSIPELDRLVVTAQGIAGVYGARMTGAGFGGSIVVLLRAGTVPALQRAFGDALTIVRASDGASALE
jgi:galactokinase